MNLGQLNELNTTVSDFHLTPFTLPCNSSNATCIEGETIPPMPYSPGLTAFLATIAGITSFFTTTGNILVVLAFILEKHIRQPSNYLIASLAITDILIGMFSMPFYTLYLLKAYWPLGRLLCDLWLSLDYTVCLVSQYTVFLITLDRFCSVKAPAKYRNWRTTNKIKIMIAVTWLFPALIFFTSILGWHSFTGKQPEKYSCYAQFQQDPLFSTILVISYYWVTLVIMTGLYIGIYKVALSLHLKARAKRNRIKAMRNLAANNNDAVPLNNGAGIYELAHTENNGVHKKRSSKKKKEKSSSDSSQHQEDSDISNDNSSDETYSPRTVTTRTTASINTNPSPVQMPSNLESPLWKPRPSLPNSRINWDAFGDTRYSSVHPIETVDENTAMTPQSEREDNSPDSQQHNVNLNNNESSKDKVFSQLGRVFTHIGNLRFRKQDESQDSPKTKSKSENRARKALRTITFILGAFVMCWTPYHVVVLIAAYCGDCVNTRFYEFTYWLCYMNSPLNPFCYALSNQQFKRAFIKIIKGEHFRKNNCLKR